MIESPKAIIGCQRSPQQEQSLKQKQPLPDYGLRYFDHLHGKYQSLPPDKIAEYKTVFETLLKKREQNDPAPLNWYDLYTFDLVLAKLQPDESLPRIAWNLRSRYRDVAGLREYDAYIASKPPELVPSPPESPPAANIKYLRADIEYLLGQIHLRYAMGTIRTSTYSKFSKKFFWVAFGSIVFILGYIALMRYLSSEYTAPYWQASILAVVISVGAIGGLVSVQQRFQSASREGDPVDNVSVFNYGWWDILPSIVSGAIFAAVFYVLIASGLLSGQLFPAMGPSSSQNTASWNLISFLTNTIPEKNSDYAKLLIWSFIVGFAERFVPDTLSQFVKRSQTESGAKG